MQIKNKKKLVHKVFTKVAKNYDLMNDLMSFGLHRTWKKKLVKNIIEKRGKVLLDVAGGTGDIAFEFIENGGESAIICDINNEMLKFGKEQAINKNKWNLPVKWIQGDAEKLPFKDNEFDYCTISFGIRNVSDINAALREAYRVLKTNGKFICMEFINPQSGTTPGGEEGILRKIYDIYSKKIIPTIGKYVVGESDPYEYLVDSINKFPQHDLFKKMILDAGFDNLQDQTLNFGVVGIYTGTKKST